MGLPEAAVLEVHRHGFGAAGGDAVVIGDSEHQAALAPQVGQACRANERWASEILQALSS